MARPPFGGPTPVAAALNLGTLYAFAIIEWATIRWAGRGARRPSRRADQGSAFLIAFTQWGGLALALAAPQLWPGLNFPGNPWIVVAIGLTLTWAGIALREWAIVTLGRFFRRVVMIQEGHRLVTRGPYRFVRHPSYTGALLALTGFGIALDSPVSAAALFVLSLVGYLARIKVEERALLEAFGEDYRDYARRTARLVPRVW